MKIRYIAMAAVAMVVGCGNDTSPITPPAPITSVVGAACDIRKNYKVVDAPWDVVDPDKNREVGHLEQFTLPSDTGASAIAWIDGISQGGGPDASAPKMDPGCTIETVTFNLYIQPRPGSNETFTFDQERIWLVGPNGTAYRPTLVTDSPQGMGVEWSNGRVSFPLGQAPTNGNRERVASYKFLTNGWQEYMRVVVLDAQKNYLLERAVVYGPRSPVPCKTADGPPSTPCPTS